MSLRHLTREELVERDWREQDVLEELHQERGWSATDIARRFEVEPETVLEELRERGVYIGEQTHVPKSGLARELWLRGTTPDAGENA
jgi:lambda repressor-like predicted transcriptional regulator